MACKSIEGKRFGNLTVIGIDHTERKIYNGKPRNNYFYKCVCDCGNEVSVIRNNLVSGHTASCGCLKTAHEDLTGKKYNRLTVIKLDHTEMSKRRKGGSVYYYLCRCDCGIFTVLNENYVKFGAVKSCGCLDKETKSRNGLKMGETNKHLLKKDLYEQTHCSFIKNPSKINKPNPTGIRGVCKKKNGYEANITVNRIKYCLGWYKTKEEAAQVRKEAEHNLLDNLARDMEREKSGIKVEER